MSTERGTGLDLQGCSPLRSLPARTRSGAAADDGAGAGRAASAAARPQPPTRQDELRTRSDASRRRTRRRRGAAAARPAQQREEQERARVQQLEIQARQDLDRASRLAYQAEQAQGLQAATGRISEANLSRVLLQLQDGRTMSFQIDHRTKVLIGSEERSVADVQQGAEARVAFDPRSDQRTAITIRVAPAGRDLGAIPRAPGTPETEPPSRR
jgi:hypothetical protein